ncbi:MAG: hypothetical protein IJW73_04720 [Candidatus Gastranaerophilales bacterium]|nr:hypothetical protein [Candidatus Gastranaerophilales bacterium]
MKKKLNIDITAHNKLTAGALIISIALMVAISIWANNKVQWELDESYRKIGGLLTKTLAVQNFEITQAKNSTALNFIKAHVNSILASTEDISFIAFKDNNSKIIYSTDEQYHNRPKSNTTISSPIVDGNDNTTGSVEVGLSANLAKNVTDTTKNSMFWVFSIVWLVFTFVTLLNAYLIRRELTILHHGVKEIENGKFGTVLNYNQASGEIKELFDAFNDMSKKLHSYEEQNVDQLTLERNKLEAVLMSIANGVVVCDNFDKISIVNSAAQKILNSTEKDILNTSIQNYCDSTGELCFREKINVFKNTPLDVIEKKPLEFNINVEKRIIKSIISPMYSKMHDYLGYIIVLIDITKEAEVDKLKNDFISNVSHELRTPVTILSSYADTLYNFGNDFSFEEQKEFIGTINEEVIRLNRMVNDILDFSKLQSDRTLEKEKQNIARTIEKIVTSHKVLADEKNISITFIKEEKLPTISYNAQSIERVVSNLITNAIKYSPNNSRVKIRAEIARDPNFLEVTVEDNGMGIPVEHQKMIFERFYRIENQVHTVKGTGLGLHLVKVAIEKHHKGHVFVKSKPNEGSTFGFWLPLDKADVGKKPSEVAPKIAVNNNDYQEYEIKNINDYNKKAKFDNEYISQNTKEETNLVFKEIENNNNPIKEKEIKKPYRIEDEWEITYEVRDN